MKLAGKKIIISTFGDYLRLHGEQKFLVNYCIEHDFREMTGNGYIVRKAHSFEAV